MIHLVIFLFVFITFWPKASKRVTDFYLSTNFRIGKLFQNNINKDDRQTKYKNERLFKEKEYDS